MDNKKNIKIPKIALIGAGNIGGTLAHLLLIKQLGHIVLFDITPGIPQGKALDLMQCGAVEKCDSSILGTNDYADCIDADVVIVTAGVARKPGMSRDDLLLTNSKVMQSVGENIKKYCPNAFVICITNPLDAMVKVLQDASNTPDHMIVGMAGVLDSARFSFFLAQELKVSLQQINAYVLGGHGDAMVPLTEMSNVSGMNLPTLVKMGKLSQERLDAIIDRTRKGGGEIVSLLKTGSAFYAPAHSAVLMAQSYLQDTKQILSMAVKLTKGQYDLKEPLFIGVLAKIGSNGVEEIIDIALNPQERAMLQISIDAVIELNKAVASL